ncbi:retrovirus-related Pol polyprotein from transposon TNT 1-94 [Trichonephila clavipes]|uniref:Retrovirus-related Pol polyprotein from transposon TNT 1-94 n=1 Tax=Trichonephila clavipes TaxID=2585209 RepID=A0A8X6SFU6_TRICX|nr:retrovirus-related Pol polyprotein from transposon TNT 1-94 [Trichonephila clavipes]
MDECMLIHQIPYIDEIYKKYEHLNIPISSLPIAKGIQYSERQCPQSNDEKIEMKEIPYRNVLGCLSFLAGRTRPDISYAVNIFSQFQNDPGLDHWYGLLKLFGYVNKTKHYKLRLNCRYIDIVDFSDADFAANRDDRVSMGGQFICLGNAPITWRTFKEKSIEEFEIHRGKGLEVHQSLALALSTIQVTVRISSAKFPEGTIDGDTTYLHLHNLGMELKGKEIFSSPLDS